MSAKAVREYHGKRLLAKHLGLEALSVLVGPDTVIETLPDLHPWLLQSQLVVKPDQRIKRRGKAGLLGVNLDWKECQAWIDQRMDSTVSVESVTGKLEYFLVEPFVPHSSTRDEYYICVVSHREGDDILFTSEGGVDVGDVDAKASKISVGSDSDGDLTPSDVEAQLLHDGVPASRRETLAQFILDLLNVYRKLNFTYLEINPLVVLGHDADTKIVVMDLAAKIDETAAFLNSSDWGHLDFPPPFGRDAFPEENYIRELDSKTGASLKLTILNKKGRIWTMVAGGTFLLFFFPFSSTVT